MAKIYTKMGDKGTTSLVGGQKVAKTDDRIWGYGTVDELNSFLGNARAELDRLAKGIAGDKIEGPASAVDALSKLNADLEIVQHWLFDLGSLLASIPADREKMKLPPMTMEQVIWLEKRIDGAMSAMPAIREFILPAGSEIASRLHITRTVCRRAERFVIKMNEQPEYAVIFLNRLSDYLFAMARYANHVLGLEDVKWKKTIAPSGGA